MIGENADGCDVFAEVAVGDVEIAGPRREGRRIPVLRAGRGGTDVAHDSPDLFHALFRIDFEQTGLQIDSG